MTERKNLYLGVLLAPYRLDYYNYLHEHMNCEIYFQLHGFEGQLFSTEELERQCTFTPHYLQITRLVGDRQMVWNLRQVIRQLRPEVVIVPEFSVLAIQVMLLKKLFGYKYKVVSQCDDSYDMLEHKGFSRLHGLSRKLLMPFMDDLILLDKRSTDWYQAHYGKGIFMPLIIDETKQDAGTLSEARTLAKDLRGRDGVKTILFVGRLIDVKNLFVLMDACRKLDFPHRLVIVGDGELRRQLEEYAAKTGTEVLFAGRQNGANLLAWYYAADVFVLPSFLEPFGAVTNEALLCGCNCCISRLAGSACLIEEGKNGYLCDPHDVDDIARQITRTAELPCDGQRNSKMPYTFSVQMDRLIEGMKPLMKVTHVVARLDLGGAERVAFNIAESGNPRIEYHVVEVEQGRSEFSEKMKEELRSHGIQYHTSPVRGNKPAIVLFPLWFAFTYLRIRPNVIHAHTEIPDLALWIFRKVAWVFFRIRPKYVRTIHNTQLWNEWKFIGKVVERFYRKHRCNVAISKAVKAVYEKEYGQADVPLIYNGLAETPQEAFPHLVRGKKNILFAGRLEPQKGIGQLITVITALGDDSRYHFHVVGSGSQGERVKEALGALPNVSLYEKVYGLARYMGSFDYLFMPSVHEGLVLTCIEASLAGTPAVVNWCAGIDETLPEDWPLRVRDNDVEAFLRLFREVLPRVDYESLQKKARQFALRHFSIKEMQRAYERLYLSL